MVEILFRMYVISRIVHDCQICKNKYHKNRYNYISTCFLCIIIKVKPTKSFVIQNLRIVGFNYIFHVLKIGNILVNTRVQLLTINSCSRVLDHKLRKNSNQKQLHFIIIYILPKLILKFLKTFLSYCLRCGQIHRRMDNQISYK